MSFATGQGRGPGRSTSSPQPSTRRVPPDTAEDLGPPARPSTRPPGVDGIESSVAPFFLVFIQGDRRGGVAPGRSSFRNSTPAFSNARITRESVAVREPISPLKLSIRLTVPIATRERLASSICSIPSSARAARNCLPVINKAPYHAKAAKPKHVYMIHN